jgi:hypothetical protein
MAIFPNLPPRRVEPVERSEKSKMDLKQRYQEDSVKKVERKYENYTGRKISRYDTVDISDTAREMLNDLIDGQ